MQPGWVILLAVIGGAVVIGLGVYAMVQARKRREALAALAARLGLAFTPDSDPSLDERFPFGCFTRGHSRRAYNILSGPLTFADRQFHCLAGDYLYKVTRNSGKSRSTSTYRFSFILLSVPFAGAKPLSIRAEGWLDKVAGALGFDDIDFESEEFSRKFHVKSPDRRFAYAVIHPRMMEFLLAHPGPPLEIAGGAACLTDGSRRWEPATFESTLEWARAFFEQWPAHVIDDLKAREEYGA